MLESAGKPIGGNDLLIGAHAYGRHNRGRQYRGVQTYPRPARPVAAVRADSGRSHGKIVPDHVTCAGPGLRYKLSIPLTYPMILLKSAESTSE
jgi:hypothetical protein